MGMRFRKSIGNGIFKVNVSKSGVGTSVGVKGARVSKKANGGTRATVSIPGTGVSYVKDSKQGKRTTKNSGSVATQDSGCRIPYTFFSVIFWILGFLLTAFSLLAAFAVPVVGIIGIVLGVLCFIASGDNKKKAAAQKAELEAAETAQLEEEEE